MTTYREAIRAALALHADYRMLAASEHYLTPPRNAATVHAVAEWYGTDPAVYVYDEYAGTYRVTDRRTYRALSVLLRVAPIGGRSYLGMPLRTALAASVLAAGIGAGISAAIPTPDVYGDDGYPVLTPVEHADVLARYASIRDARTGGRFTEDAATLAECAKTNGATLTVEACRDYLAERYAVAERCGAIGAQLAYERCADAALTSYRATGGGY